MPVVRIAAPAAQQIAAAREWWLENRDKAPSGSLVSVAFGSVPPALVSCVPVEAVSSPPVVPVSPAPVGSAASRHVDPTSER